MTIQRRDSANWSFAAVMESVRAALNLKNQKELAAVLGIKPNAFYNRKRTGAIPFDHIVRLAAERGFSLDWLFYGVGAQANEGHSPIAPFAVPDAALLAAIFDRIERSARAKSGDPASLREVTFSIARCLMAVDIYNRVIHIRPDSARAAETRDEVDRLIRMLDAFGGVLGAMQLASETANDEGRRLEISVESKKREDTK